MSPSPGAQSDASTADTPAGPAKPRTWTAPSASPTAAARGTSSGFRYSGAAGARDYTLYVPPGLDASDAAPAPLLVMLHGCTQSPDDFATGTRMNALADAHGVLVAYPSQTARDNGSRCWNWFRREDQQRGSGEPAILAGIVADIAARQRVDPRRVYVAGLSAGAAMAVILGRTYPDVFAAVGAHSGLPFGAAQDVPGAFAAMQGRGTARTAPGANAVAAQRMPTIVLHGSADHTVQAGNGTAIVEDATAGNAATPPLRAGPTETLRVNGREATRTAYVDDAGRVQVEHVVIAGAGHAWSGGDAAGSHTDAQGPDASALILAFCLQHAR
ncbi:MULTISPECIES: extracellular catalytic domain type 1 short-chain-length polyhydroxyalkanoate depolymerase [Luteimonas]|uniref:extracellular catalytic domain type 1 short-chain-length polyhydroxyalkanoate depolymerase n=1 Tax=Luteimonas TaxID=83614 RepID=UPI0018ED5B9E|nr:MULTISPECIES: PHB depolymerase family esterase [Luteimonas]